MTSNSSNMQKNTRSLSVTLAIAFLSLSVAALLANGAFAVYANIQREQGIVSVQQQLVAQDASQEVSGFFEDNFQTLEATTKIVYLPQGSPEQRKLILDSLLATQPSFRQVVLLDASGEQAAQVSRISLELSSQFVRQLQQMLLEQLQPFH